MERCINAILKRKNWRSQECRPPIKKPYIGCQKGKARKGPNRDYMVADSRERNEADGEDLEQHSGHSKGPADVEGLCCYATCPPPQSNWHE